MDNNNSKRNSIENIDVDIRDNALNDIDNTDNSDSKSIDTEKTDNHPAEKNKSANIFETVQTIKKAVRMSEVPSNGIDDAVSNAVKKQKEKERDFHNYLSNLLTEFIYRFGTDLNGRILEIKVSGGEILFFIKYPGFLNNFKRCLIYNVNTFLVNGKTYSRDVFYNELLHSMATFPEKNGIRHFSKNSIIFEFK